MNKTIFKILAICVFPIVCLVLSKKLQILITSPLRSEVINTISKKNLPELKLEVPLEVQNTFDSIYSLYDEDFDGEKYRTFIKKLNAENSWKRAKINFLNQEYDVKIKLHGKSPTQHVEGDHYSLGVKVLDGKKINGVTRFNLIVYWRIRYNFDLVKYLANALDIFCQNEELLIVNINERSPKLYYFEYRVNQEFFEKIDKSNFVILKLRSDHSLVYNGGDLDEWDAKLEKALEKSNLNDSVKALVYERYSSLNQAIYEKDVETTLKHFDIDYLSKIQAFRYLFSDSGHGFGRENLLVAFDYSTLTFYPFVHRDNGSPFPLNTSVINDQFDGTTLGLEEFDLPLFTVLSQSDLLAQKTKEYLIDILQNKKVSSITLDSIIKEHNSYYYSSLLKQTIGMQQKHPASSTIVALEKYLLR